eukprot:7777902-Alexandrium_andersonii.AAC.1
MVEPYAALGGDEWLTEDSMRAACGVGLRDRTAAGASQDVAQLQAASQDVRDGSVVGLESVSYTHLRAHETSAHL